MRELFYAIYKNQGYPGLIYTCIAEAVLKGKGHFVNNRFVIRKNAKGLYSEEIRILDKVYLNELSKFKTSDYYEFIEVLKHDCFKRAYVNRVWFCTKITSKYVEDLKSSFETFNLNMVTYIDTGDIASIKSIINNVEKIKFPELIVKGSPRIGPYKDRLAILEEAARHRLGLFK